MDSSPEAVLNRPETKPPSLQRNPGKTHRNTSILDLTSVMKSSDVAMQRGRHA